MRTILFTPAIRHNMYEDLPAEAKARRIILFPVPADGPESAVWGHGADAESEVSGYCVESAVWGSPLQWPATN